MPIPAVHRAQGILEGRSMIRAISAGSTREQPYQRATQEQRGPSGPSVSREVVKEQGERTGCDRARHGAGAGHPRGIRRGLVFRIQ
jgi:hypothetical protein